MVDRDPVVVIPVELVRLPARLLGETWPVAVCSSVPCCTHTRGYGHAYVLTRAGLSPCLYCSRGVPWLDG